MLRLLMRIRHQFGAVVLLLMSWLAPAMGCLVPDAQLTPQERACCRTMKDQCGQMRMPASHDCCQKDIQALRYDTLQVKSVDLHPDIVATTHLILTNLWNPELASHGWVEYLEWSPPQSPPASISVLRI
jgi:hypothetical protein